MHQVKLLFQVFDHALEDKINWLIKCSHLSFLNTPIVKRKIVRENKIHFIVVVKFVLIRLSVLICQDLFLNLHNWIVKLLNSS